MPGWAAFFSLIATRTLRPWFSAWTLAMLPGKKLASMGRLVLRNARRAPWISR